MCSLWLSYEGIKMIGWSEPNNYQGFVIIDHIAFARVAFTDRPQLSYN